jgi:ABC-type antimicrobial peptide transport system permease subunit
VRELGTIKADLFAGYASALAASRRWREEFDIPRGGGQSIPGIVPATAVVMILVGILALAGPARRAIRIDPAEALRTN